MHRAAQRSMDILHREMHLLRFMACLMFMLGLLAGKSFDREHHQTSRFPLPCPLSAA